MGHIMLKNKKYLLCLIWVFLFSNMSFGQGIKLNNTNYDIKIFNKTQSITKISDLYKYTADDELVNTKSIISSQFNFAEIKPNENKSLAELRFELESIPISKDIKIKTSTDSNEDKQESKSFFKSEIFYFACAAVLAATAYMVWKKNDEPVNTSKTFGTPPLPQNN